MKIVIATYMDWDALYIDGINVYEDHTVYACDIAYVLEGKFPCNLESMEIKAVDETWWYDGDRDGYPEKIEDVVFEE